MLQHTDAQTDRHTQAPPQTCPVYVKTLKARLGIWQVEEKRPKKTFNRICGGQSETSRLIHQENDRKTCQNTSVNKAWGISYGWKIWGGL